MPSDTKNKILDSQETLDQAKKFLAQAKEKLRLMWEEISQTQRVNEQNERAIAERLQEFMRDIEVLQERLEQEPGE